MRQWILWIALPACLLLAGTAAGQVSPAADTATAATAKKKKEPEAYGHQLRLSFDIAKPIINALTDSRYSYEFALDYYHRNEVYFVLEGGYGGAPYHYPDLNYDTRNFFVRAGIDKTLIKRIGDKDWDMAFFGLRYAVAPVRRDVATYTIIDSVWGSSTGTVPAATTTAHWAELTGGIKVELLQNLMVGWNLRGRFLLNETSFRELRPVFIAGFGRGDRSMVFDFNVFLSYGIRWGAKKGAVTNSK